MDNWAPLITSIGALVTAAGLFYAAWTARKKNQTDVTLTITQAAENIVAMREKDIAELKAEIRDREADVELLKKKVLDKDAGIEALNIRIEAQIRDIRELRNKVLQLQRYIEYLHKFIIEGKKKKTILSFEQYLQRTAEAKTHFEEKNS